MNKTPPHENRTRNITSSGHSLRFILRWMYVLKLFFLLALIWAHISHSGLTQLEVIIRNCMRKNGSLGNIASAVEFLNFNCVRLQVSTVRNVRNTKWSCSAHQRSNDYPWWQPFMWLLLLYLNHKSRFHRANQKNQVKMLKLLLKCLRIWKWLAAHLLISWVLIEMDTG